MSICTPLSQNPLICFYYVHTFFSRLLARNTLKRALKRGARVQLVGHVVPGDISTEDSRVTPQCTQQLLLHLGGAVKAHHKVIALKVLLLLLLDQLWQVFQTHVGDITNDASVCQNQLAYGGHNLDSLLVCLERVRDPRNGHELIEHGGRTLL